MRGERILAGVALQLLTGVASFAAPVASIGPHAASFAGSAASFAAPSAARPNIAARLKEVLLARARELEEAGDARGAYEAYTALLEQPGLSDSDTADAEIGAANTLRAWTEAQRRPDPSPGVKAPPPGSTQGPPAGDDAYARLLASAKRWAGTPQEPKVLLALATLEEAGEGDGSAALAKRHLETALALFDRVASTAASPAEGLDAELGAALCLRELERPDEARERLEAALGKTWAPRERARIAIAVARQLCGPRLITDESTPSPRQIADAERGLALSRSVVAGLPDSSEAAQAFHLQATCLRDAGRMPEALSVYEEVALTQAGSLRAANALLSLGLYYHYQEDRGRAASYFRRVVVEYPSAWRPTRSAGIFLQDVDRYTFSPLYDRLMRGIERRFVEGGLQLGAYAPAAASFLSMSLTVFVARLGALALCLVLLAALARLAPPGRETGLLLRDWTIRRLVLVTVALWTGWLALRVGQAVFMTSLPTWLFFQSDRIAEGGLALAMIGVTLWREPLATVLGIPRRAALRTSILLGCSGLVAIVGTSLYFVLRAMLIEAGHVAPVTKTIFPGPDPGQPWWYVVPHYLFCALAEESFFRGAVFQAFKGRTAVWSAAMLSSLLFALYHLYPLSSGIWVFAFGILAAWLVQKTKSLGPPTLVHAALNLFLYALRR